MEGGRGGEGKGRTVKGVPLGTGNREGTQLNSIGGGRDRHRDGQLPNRVNAIADSTMEREGETFLPLPFMLILFSPLFVPGEEKTFCEAGAGNE